MEVSNGGGSEVRKIHIVYFLSLMGRSEEPHLIRVHHLARNGVYLRDVKRWIGEVRGKDLAETFAWSYKRRYRTGYVWQDLLDDDLITPISDNEYVLKGSQIHPPSFGKASIMKEEIPLLQVVHDTEAKKLKQKKKQPLITEELQLGRFPRFNSNSLYQLSLADETESCKVELDKHNPNGQSKNQSNENSKTETPDSSFSISLSASSSSSLSLSPLKGSKRFSTESSGLFRNLIPCGALDTNADDIMIMLSQTDKTVSKNSNILDDNNAKIRKHDRFGGSARNLRSCWNPQRQDEARKSSDGKSTNKNKKKLGEFLNQISHKPFGGSIFWR